MRCLLLLLFVVPQDSNDLVITKSTELKGNRRGMIRIKGDNITLDCTGATLVGVDDKPADGYTGFGLVAENCKNLTIKGLSVRAYKVGMHFTNCDGLKLIDCDVSRNFRQHLKSTPRGEVGADWLYGHENDDHEWMRHYGAGIYVENSKNVTVQRCRARNGQNGLCLDRVTESAVIDCDMSFMSGWGLAMWRSSKNDISNNKFDWCMRGFSHKVYHRGQDSAGIFVFEQCSDNVFAYNSATHGGDGFFLYAGNETLKKTGKGGCNRNILYRNDFSHAAANGIECTFSDGNVFVENILDECDHGVWAGYSYNTTIVGNHIGGCNNGVSIEHGHDNRIESNTFDRCGIGVHAWANHNKELDDGIYGQNQETKSRGYVITRNTFTDVKKPQVLENTTEVTTEAKPFAFTPPKTRGTQDAFLPKTALRGWKYIFVDDWGPYDFTTPRLFPNEVAAWGSAEMFLLGPDGEFTIGDIVGATVSPTTGKLPATLKITSPDARVHEFSFTVKTAKESLKATGVLLFAKWEVTFHGWEPAGAQKPPKDWEAVMASKPLDSMTLDKIDFPWGGGKPSDKVPADHFATVATTSMELPAGTFEVSTVSDDGVRVWLDEKLVIDNWTWHPPHEDKATAKLAKGKHAIRIEHFEIDGFAQLQFNVRPIK